MIHETALRPQSSGVDRRPPLPSMTARKATGAESSTGNALRQRIGNQAVQRLMGDASGTTHKSAPVRALAIQTKLTVSQPGDAHEQEADRVANAVMRIPSPDLQQKPSVSSEGPAGNVQRLCAECDEENGKKPGAQVKRKEQSAAAPPLSPAAAAKVEGLRGDGSALPAATRAFFEQRFGADFGIVRVHTGARAEEAAESIGAKAFTLGNHIGFGKGQYSPASGEGQRLLAHELTHVVQQAGGAGQPQAGTSAPRTPASGVIQRACKGAVPKATCTLDPGATPPSTRFFFNVNCDDFDSRLPPFLSEEGRLAAFAATIPATATVRIVGMSSFDGPAELNERLACSRADKGASVVRKSVPSGVTISSVIGIVGGPSTASDSKQRAVALDVSKPTPPPPPPSLCPKVPTSTPATCLDRNAGYCAAAACFPSNPWLNCVCTTSLQICEAVDAFTFKSVHGMQAEACIDGTVASPTNIGAKIETGFKGKWFLDTNKCIWGHWRAALDALHDPSLPVPAGLTGPWVAAISVCRSKGAGSSECCKAQVDAEQKAIDTCGSYDSGRFGKLPTDIPFAPICSLGAKLVAPPPPFTGDFGNAADRISYGNRRCCP